MGNNFNNRIRIKKQQSSGSNVDNKVISYSDRINNKNRRSSNRMIDEYEEEDSFIDDQYRESKFKNFALSFIKKFVALSLIVIIVGGSAGFIYVRGVINEMPVLTKKIVMESYINKEPVALNKVPKTLQNAIISIEDQRFYSHKGVDIKSLLRSFVNNIGGDNLQGGSTIEMQLSKNILTTNEKTLKRKIQDIYNAKMLNQIMTKEEILEAYLNNIYLGNSAYGVNAGAQLYFGSNVDKLNFGQCTMLAGITNNPRLYQNYEQAKKRQAIVLYKMYELGYIKEHVYKAQLYRDTPFKSEIE